MFKAKIVVVGPCESGKSVVSNFLGDQTDISQSGYHPTAGVRILEFETPVDNGRTQTNMDVELWDCSGNDSYEGCWAAMAFQADGVVLVYDPSTISKSVPSFETFYNYFVVNRNLKPSQFTIFANCKNKEARNITSPIPSVPITVGSIEKNPEDIRDAFKKFLQKVYRKLSESRDKEELSMMS